jgi:uncharacterized protein (DUF1015 family)
MLWILKVVAASRLVYSLLTANLSCDLHRLIIEKCLCITEDAVKKGSHITYVRERDAAVKVVREGKAQIAFLLSPTRLDQIRDIAYEGNVMPQKSTDFYPKVLSGLTMYSLE